MIKKVIPEANKLVRELELVNFIKETIVKESREGFNSASFYRKSYGIGATKSDVVVDYIIAKKWDFKDLGYQISLIGTEGDKVSGVIISW